MRKIIAKYLSVAILLPLITTIVGPSAVLDSAHAANITKTIIVRDSSGNLLPGALVQMLGYTAADEVATELVTTNSLGQAVISMPDNYNWHTLQIMPPAGNTTDAALIQNRSNEFLANDTTNIQLNASNLKVDLLKSDGSAMLDANNKPVKYWICFPGINYYAKVIVETSPGQTSTQCFWQVRTGAFGVYIPKTDLSTGSNYKITLRADSRATDGTVFSNTYGLKLDGSSNLVMYTDTTYNTVKTATAGVYTLNADTYNLVGTLKTATGGAFTMPANSWITAQFYKLTSNGVRDYSVTEPNVSNAVVGPNGQIYGRLRGNVAGSYEIMFTPDGAAAANGIPSFTVKLFQNSSGQFSLTDSNYQNAPLNFEVNLPAAANQYKFAYVDPVTNALTPGYFQLSENTYKAVVALDTATDGNIAFAKSVIYKAGTYSVYTEPSDFNLLAESFTLTVATDGATPVVTNSAGTVITANSSGVYLLPYKASNLRIRIVHPTSGSLSSGRVIPYLCKWSDVGNWSDCAVDIHYQDSKYFASSYLPNGSYALMFNMGGDPTLASNTYKVVANNGTMTVTDSLGASLTQNGDGTFSVSPQLANLKFKVSYPTDATKLIYNSYVNFCTVNSDNSIGSPCYGATAMGGTVGLRVPNGNYEITVSPNKDGFSNKRYKATVNNGAITSSTPSISTSGGFNLLSAAAANLKLQLVSPTDSNTSLGIGSWVDYCANDNSGCYGYGADTTGKMSLSLEDGSYTLRVHPNSSSSFAVKTYAVSVSGGVVSITGVSADGAGLFKLAAASSNITLNVKKSDGSSITFGNNQGLDVSIWKWDGTKNNWNWYQSAGWYSSGTVALNISETGTFRIQINPRGLSGVATTYTKSFVITSGPNISYDGDSAASTKSFNFNLASPNLNIKVTNPLDSSLMSYGWVSIEKITNVSNNDRYWVQNADLTNVTPGLTAASLDNGNYLLTVNPPQGNQTISGLATKQYNLVVNGATLTLKTGSIVGSGNAITVDGNGYYPLTLNAANITGRLVDQSGVPVKNTNNSWSSINLQKLRSDGINWDWSNNWANPNQDGFFSMRLDETGTYRLRIESYGRSDLATTFSETFSVTDVSAFNKNFGEIKLLAPTLKLKVRKSGAASDSNWVGIEIRKDGQFVDWAGTGNNGIAVVNLTSAGTYDFIVNPPGDGSVTGVSRKTYKAVATSNGGVISATVTGVTAAGDGSYTLNFGTPALTGTVVETNTATTVANSTVVAINTVTGQDMWDYSANTDNSGVWNMSLPQGTYKLYARTPWGNATLANGDPVGTVTIAADGTASLSGDAATGRTTSTFKLSLNGPFWSGTIKGSDNSTLLRDARACLYTLISSVGNWNCANTDVNGNWAMSKPVGFTAFDSNSRLEIASNVPSGDSMRVITGTNIGSTLNPSGASAIGLTLLAPNASVRVLDKDGNPAPNIWVSVDRNNVGWLGGASTDSTGWARFNVDLSSGFNVRVETSGNPTYSGTYAPVFLELSTADVAAATSSSLFSKAITLSTPNIRGLVTDPATNAPAANSWVELYDQTNNRWMGGSNTDANGLFAINASATNVTYTLTVNPPWNSSSTSARHSYTAIVGASVNTVSLSDDISSATLSKDGNGIYAMSLATPTLNGFVKNPGNTAGVQNSWVSTFNSTTSQWFGGANSNANGSFGMALPNGNYNIEANVPWNMGATYARSAQCSIVVAAGAVSSATGCTQASDKSVTLNLRSPNLTFTLKDASGNPIQNAYVGLGFGSWNTGGQSDADGKVSLFVDKAAAKAAWKKDNGSDPTGNMGIWVWIDPPYGTSTVVRVNCQSGIGACSAVDSFDFSNSSDYPTKSIDITMPAPDTKILVKKDGVAVGRDAWVEIFKLVSGNWNWVASSNTDNSGYATFNLSGYDKTNDRFVVRVNAPWNLRATYSSKTYDNTGSGLAWSAIDYTTNNANSFSLATPNLRLIIKANSTTVNKWGWVGIEKYDSSGNYQSWVGSYGLDEVGKAAVLIPSSGKFKITSYPGPGKPGAATSCFVNTSAGGAISSFETCTAGSHVVVGGIEELSLTLNSGNIIGHVTRSTGGTAVVGAVVYANWASDFYNDANAVVTSTDENGNYGLQLDPSKQWKIKIIPMTPTDGSAKLASSTSATFTPPGSGSNNIDFQLGNA